MDIYVNNILRTDIAVMAGGSLSENSSHKTSSSIKVKVPLNSSLGECDYIKIINNGTTVFAGTILKANQDTYDNIGLDYKTYSLTVANNSDYVASVMVDMFFSEGTSIDAMLNGNHDAAAPWDNFAGILESRVYPEGITIGIVDDFSQITLSADASLWGKYVTDVLDELCSAANAWWNITVDKVFNMRYNSSVNVSPHKLTDGSKVYDISISKDALTTYSAVRVIGGKGKGAERVEYKLSITDTTKVELDYPFHSNIYVNQEVDAGIIAFPVGIKGLHDNNPNYWGLISYGAQEIECKEGHSFISGCTLNISYYPLVTIATRVQSDSVAGTIASKRGGTGTIEYTLKDDTIIDYQSAVQAGISFLKDAGKFATEISFKSLESGYNVGDILEDCSLPYYSINGNYQINEISAVFLNHETVEYTVKASNVSYRDKSAALFSKAQKQTFVLKNEVPASTGKLIESEIEVETTIEVRAIQPKTWAEVDAEDKTWAEKDALNIDWEQIENTIKEVISTGNYLTQTAKNAIAKVLNGEAPDTSVKLNHYMEFYNDQIDPKTTLTNEGSLVTNNEILTIYTANEQQANYNIQKLFSKNSDFTELQEIPLYFEKTSDFSLTIAKKDVIK